MPGSSHSYRSIIMKGLGYSQMVLLTVALVCLAFNQALIDRNKATREQLKPVIEELEALREKNAISSKELHAITDHFNPLMYPTLYDPWLLRYALPVGLGCLILNSLLLMFSLRWRSRGALPEVARHQEAAHG